LVRNLPRPICGVFMAPNQGFTLWLTGMSGAGKTTLVDYIAARLRQVGRAVEVLDENDLAEDFWGGTADTKEERNIGVKRLGLVATLLTRSQVAALVASVSPYKAAREDNRRLIGRYLEVYVDCPTEKLIQRDSTGKYKKALAGEIPNFVGITEPYEPPGSPEVTIRSDVEAVEAGAMRIFQSLLDLGYVAPDELKVITGQRMRAVPPGRRAPAARPGPGARARPPARRGWPRRASRARPSARAERRPHAHPRGVGAAGGRGRPQAPPSARGAPEPRLGAGGLLWRCRFHLRPAGGPPGAGQPRGGP